MPNFNSEYFNSCLIGNCLNFKGKEAILYEILSNEENLDAFSSFIQNNSHITALNLENCNSDSKKIKLLINLINNSHITDLNISNFGMNDADAEEIAKALENNAALISLNLRNNSIEVAGAEAIAKALENNAALISLNLQSNCIGVAGAEEIAKALENNAALISLNLQSNCIGVAGAEEIAKALENNAALISLNLRNNSIEVAGAEAIAKALEVNKTLISLEIACNKINTKGIEAISKALDSNITLTSVDLGTNIAVEVKEEINKKLQRNKEINDSRKDISESFKAIISEITLDTDGILVLSLDKEGSEQNSCLNKLKEYSDKYGVLLLPVLEQIIDQSLYQNTVHVYQDEIELLSFAARSDALTKVTQTILEYLGFKEDKINEFNSKIVEIIKEVEEMFLLELDISNNNMAETWEINTETEKFNSTSSLPFLFYHKFTMGDTWLPFPNMNVELLDVLQKADDSQEVELKNNQQLASLYKQFPDLKTPGIILQKTLEDAINGSSIGDIEILLKEKPYKQIFKHNSLIQILLNKFNKISEIKLHESALSPEQKEALEALLAQYPNTHPSNTSEHTEGGLVTDEPMTPDLMGSSHHITDSGCIL